MVNPGSSCFEQLIALFAIPIMLILSFLGLSGDIGEPFGGVPMNPEIVTALAPTVAPLPTLIPTPTAAPSASGEAGAGQFAGEIIPGGGAGWTYEGTAGEIISIEVRADNPANDASEEDRERLGLLDTYVYVYAPDGSLLVEADDIERGVRTDTQIDELVLPETGTYLIEVRSWSNTTGGGYTLSIKSNLNSEVEAAETDEP